MSEIHSFNALFVEAETRGVRLNNLVQLDSGLFRSNWRHDGTGATKMFGPHVDHERPFDAARDSFLALLPALQPVAAAPTDLFDAPAAADAVSADLFG